MNLRLRLLTLVTNRTHVRNMMGVSNGCAHCDLVCHHVRRCLQSLHTYFFMLFSLFFRVGYSESNDAAESKKFKSDSTSEVKRTIHYMLYINGNKIGTCQLHISGFVDVNYTFVKNAIMTKEIIDQQELCHTLYFPYIEIYYGDIKTTIKKTLVDEDYNWSEKMKWGATEDSPLIVEMNEFSETEKAQINCQIQKVLTLWNATTGIEASIHKQVAESLLVGRIPPIFHTLILERKNWLFSPEKIEESSEKKFHSIRFSVNPVTAGNAMPDTAGTISAEPDASYIAAFFEEGSVARQEVKDRSLTNPWIFSENYSQAMASLVNTPAVMIGEDMEVTKLKQYMDVDDSQGCNLITRRLSRGVVADCFQRSQKGSIYAIVGSPGIGKSWTLIYALQQALLYEDVCVLFFFQKRINAIACIRRNGKIYVWCNRHPELHKCCSSDLFQNRNVVVLLDPKESTAGGAEFTNGSHMSLYAASNDVKHFHNEQKITPDFLKYLSVLLREELKIGCKYMVPDLMNCSFSARIKVISEIVKRAEVVGYLPRYVRSTKDYNARIKQTDWKTKNLSDEEVKKLFHWNGMTDKFNMTHMSNMSGCVFSVNAAVIASCSASEELSYDGGDGIDYGTLTLSIMSESVASDFIKKYRTNILNFWDKVGAGELSVLGNVVEDLFWIDLQNNSHMSICLMKSKGADFCCFKPGDNTTRLKDCTILDLKEKLFFAKEKTICRMKAGNKLLDFAGPGFKVYQVTVGDNHTMNENGLEELFIASGHCNRIDGELVVAENANDMEMIHLYWVVPSAKKILGQ